jgi:phosphonate transport system substrate-binding protein
MHRFIHEIITALCMIMVTFLPLQGQPAAFKVGVAPHTSARVIIEQYQPLRIHLEKSLGRPVEILTALDFTEFARRAVAQEFDLAITTGHQARLLQTDAGYTPLITYKADFKALAIVVAKGKIRTPKDLKGGAAIGLSSSSLVTLWGQHWLKEQKLGEVPVRYVSAADSVAQLLLSGDGSAGFVSLANFQKFQPEVRAGLRILAESTAMAGRVYVLNGRCASDLKKVDKALWTFAQSKEGLAYFEANKLEGYRKVRGGELQAMDPYAAEVRANLRAK